MSRLSKNILHAIIECMLFIYISIIISDGSGFWGRLLDRERERGGEQLLHFHHNMEVDILMCIYKT